MFRKTLALLLRALRVDARNFRPHMMRFGLVALMLYLLWFSQVSSSLMSAPGLLLFQAISYANIWFISIVGVTYFASAVTEEKEERTLGLLKMADVGALSVLLGKWLPRVLGMLSLMAVQFPFTLLAVTLGGVTIQQVSATYTALLVYLVYVGVFSLFASVICSNTGAACRVAFVMLFARSVVPWMLVSLISSPLAGSGGKSPVLFLMGDVGERLGAATISALVSRALQTTFNESIFPLPLLWMLVEAGLLFLVAWMLFEPCTRTEAVVGPSVWQRLAPRRKGKALRAWEWAIVGKDYRYVAGGALRSSLRFAIYLLISVGIPWITNWLGGGSLRPNELGYSALWFGIIFVLFDMLVSAARVFRTETQEQTWSSLVMLPRTLSNVAWSKIAGCVLGWWPSASILTIGFLLIPDALPELLKTIFSDPPGMLVTIFVILQLILVLELTTYFSVAMSWASWPLAAPLATSAVVLVNVVLWSCLFAGGIASGGVVEGLLFVVDCLAAVPAVGLYLAIGHRLAQRATDGA